MTADIGDIDKIDEALMTYDLSDDALEAAARVDGVQAITIGYCATAGSAWYCMPFDSERLVAWKVGVVDAL
jgi:hypothetical protein